LTVTVIGGEAGAAVTGGCVAGGDEPGSCAEPGEGKASSKLAAMAADIAGLPFVNIIIFVRHLIFVRT
jgi:hypothetical protein